IFSSFFFQFYIVANVLAMASAGFRSRFLVRLPLVYLAVMPSYLSIKPAFAIAVVGGSGFIFLVQFVLIFLFSIQEMCHIYSCFLLPTLILLDKVYALLLWDCQLDKAFAFQHMLSH